MKNMKMTQPLACCLVSGFHFGVINVMDGAMLHGYKTSAFQLFEHVCPMRKEQGQRSGVWWCDYGKHGSHQEMLGHAMTFSFLLFQPENKCNLRLSLSE